MINTWFTSYIKGLKIISKSLENARSHETCRIIQKIEGHYYHYSRRMLVRCRPSNDNDWLVLLSEESNTKEEY